MSILSRFVRGRRTAAFALLLSVVWLGSFAAPTSAWWGLPTRPFHEGGHLGVDSDLLSKSGLSAWAIDRYLAANTPLPPLGSAFMKAERRYGINARYLVAHAMLESGFGTSDIARYAHNLFGYHAYDRDPWRYATRFRTYAGGILNVAKAIKRDYLVPSGRFWGGAPTLRGMYMYASDPNWARKIAAIAAGLDLPTLSQLGVRLGAVAADDEITVARRATIRIPVDPGRAGALPAGTRFVVRFRPLALRQADPGITQVTKLPASLLRPTFRSPLDTNRGVTSVVLTVMAPSWPGRYAVDVVMEDTDGAQLPDASRLKIRSAIVSVSPAASVSYDVSAQASGLVVRATNTGSVAIRPTGTRNVDDASDATLEAWAVGASGGAPQLVRSLALISALAPGSSISMTIPTSRLVDSYPATVVVRVRPSGDGARPLGTPGVFSVDQDPDSGTTLVDEVLPFDPASARLLGRTAGAVATTAPSAALLAALRATQPSGTSRPATSGGQPAVSGVVATHPAKPAVIVQLHLPLAATPVDASVNSDPADTGEVGNHATIAIDAIPAGGAADEPLSLRATAHLPKQLTPGTISSGLIGISTTAAGPASYLAIGRILVTAGGRTYTTAVQAFWLVVPGPSIASSSSVTTAAHATKPKPKPKAKPRTHHRASRPAAPQYRIHIVQRGETLWAIAHRSGWSIDAIRRLNPWVATVGIHPGDALKIPI